MPLIGLGKVKAQLNGGVQGRLNDRLRAIYFSGLSAIIKGTPVADGFHKNSWFLTVGVASREKTTAKSKSGSNSIRQLSKMPDSVLGKSVYFTNNAPAINILEYGGFPRPVKKGSYIKETGRYQKLSADGFSKQAPNGWVRKTIMAMANKVRK